MSDATIGGLRADWRTVQRAAPLFGWAFADVVEIGRAIALSIEADEPEQVEGWAADMRERAAWAASISRATRAAEARMRKRCELQRRAEGGGE